MSCEVCAEPTSSDMSDEPADGEDAYVSVTFRDDEGPEGAIPATTYEFCSLEHARMFVPEGEGV